MSTPVKTWASILTCLNEPSAQREPLRTETRRGQTAGPSLARLDLMFEKPQKAQVVRIKVDAVSLHSTSMAPSLDGPLLA